MLPEQFQLDVAPIASAEAVVTTGAARFTVLTDRLVRLEYDADAAFEDRPSQTVWYRQQPVPAFTVVPHGAGIVIETGALRLRYTGDGAFDRDNLSTEIISTGVVWRPGDADTTNLGGTTRTLDFVNGPTPLEPGLMSRLGWTLIDDSRAFVLTGYSLLEPHRGSGTDWYFLGYGHDYKAALRDFCAVSGPMPMIPRWILGNWWSRYWHYTQDEVVELLVDFQRHNLPLSVCILDMDWHLTQTGNRSSGWTGYTWNPALYPDPQALIDHMHASGVRTALNLHPADGVHPHEAQYPEMARRMGIDPASGEPVAFDITDPTFVQAYFDVLHHPHERMGVDFWWVDWQQGQTCRIPNLDPLWLINHLHFQDSGRDSAKRPFIFSRWGNQGHQRYPIGFSGDSYSTWDTLRFEAYMTATASNVAYGWWSHDIGGHTSGTGDKELLARWIQFGILSPIMRLHSTKGALYDHSPWKGADAEEMAVLREAMKFRHALVPYLYTMARRATQDSRPLLLPMYYDYPEHEEAYHCPLQYALGTELIAAPFVEPADPDIGLSRQVVWFPPGQWTNIFTSESFDGDRWQAIYGTLRDMPVYAKAGALLPLGPRSGRNGTPNPEELHLHVFAGADHTFTLYEDDGDSRRYLTGESVETTFSQTWDANGRKLDLSVSPSEGQRDLLPAGRTIVLHFRNVRHAQVSVERGVHVEPVTSHYDAATETLSLDPLALDPATGLKVRLWTDEHSLHSRRNRKRETILGILQSFRLYTGARSRLAELVDTLLAKPDELAPFVLIMRPSQVRALCEVLYEAGVQHIADTQAPHLLVLWNNREDPAITYRYADAYLYFGFVTSANFDQGTVPRFAVITPEMRCWSHGTMKEQVHCTQWQAQVDYHNLATVIESRREDTP